jgi:glutathione synthase/RimK-type ligase-like ATP-grasp enzyme
MRIAFLTCAELRLGQPDRGPEGREHDVQMTALHQEASRRDVHIEEVIWDDPAINWGHYDAALVGTTWDYPLKRDRFFKTLARIDAQTFLLNPLSLMRWNLDKVYLADLAKKGVPSIPTLWADAADAEAVIPAFDALQADEIVIKPRIGANAWRQARLKRGEALPTHKNLPPDACFIQPFLSSVAKYGEISMLYYNGRFSHGVRKIPGEGDYRVQSGYGGREMDHHPDAQEQAVAKAAIAALPQLPLYARIDLVRNTQNQPVIMEVELIEPYHYPEQGEGFATPLLDGLLARARKGGGA